MIYLYCQNWVFVFYLGFDSRTFTIHKTAGEGGGYSQTKLGNSNARVSFSCSWESLTL